MKESIQKLYKSLEKKYGGILTGAKIPEKKRIETGVLSLDCISGGGIPEKTAVEYFGKKSSGKTTFALMTIANYQKQNKICVFINGEKAFDKVWAANLGVDIENLLIVQPDKLEEAGKVLVDLSESNVDLIVIDSIVSIIPELEDDADIDEPKRAAQAKVNALIVRKIQKIWNKSNTSFIFINQIRDNMTIYGSPLITPGGRSLEHFYSIQVEFRKGTLIEQGVKKDKEVIGNEINLRTIKNKTYPPYKKATLDFYYNGKVDNLKSLIYVCVKEGIIELHGSYFQYKKIKQQGIENFKNAIDEKGMYEELKTKLFEKLGFKNEK